MIEITKCADTRESYVQNIITTYARANAEQKISGERWYRTAHQLAYMISDGNTRKGAGVIAALSANKSWTENTRLARHAFSGAPTGHTRTVLDKVALILDGEEPLDVLGKNAHKTRNFYLCILDPTHPTAVCVDRHAHDVAIGETCGDMDRGLSAKGRYGLLAAAYRDAAHRLNTNPSMVQAVTWVVQIESGSKWTARAHSSADAQR